MSRQNLICKCAPPRSSAFKPRFSARLIGCRALLSRTPITSITVIHIKVSITSRGQWGSCSTVASSSRKVSALMRNGIVLKKIHVLYHKGAYRGICNKSRPRLAGFGFNNGFHYDKANKSLMKSFIALKSHTLWQPSTTEPVISELSGNDEVSEHTETYSDIQVIPTQGHSFS